MTTISGPLHDLTKENTKFLWFDYCEAAFCTLKLTEKPLLSYVNENDTLILDTDASQTAAGACPSQLQNGEAKLIAFGSKCFSNTQRNMCTTM